MPFHKATLSTDARSPGDAKPYSEPVVDPDEVPPDMRQLVGLVCGFVGIIFKNKISAWAALFFCISSLATVKSSHTDLKQIVTTIGFAVMSLFSAYVGDFQRTKAQGGGS